MHAAHVAQSGGGFGLEVALRRVQQFKSLGACMDSLASIQAAKCITASNLSV
jgi:hypothetical protein